MSYNPGPRSILPADGVSVAAGRLPISRFVWLPRLPPGLGRAFWLAALLLAGAEALLHSEAWMQRYRAVFAVGRALDKVHYVEATRPNLLIVGNSRTDNGIDPRTLQQARNTSAQDAFNLGMPGANMLIYHGLITRLLQRGILAKNNNSIVLLGLDESALQEDQSLGYSPFFSDPATLWQQRRYRDWLGHYVRLWSYSANLRQLREPEKVTRMIEASLRSLDPVGGAPALYGGYRAGFGAAQNDAQLRSQETAAYAPPSPAMLNYLWLTVAALEQHHIQLVVFIPPLRDRLSAFVDPRVDAAPYRKLLSQLQARGIPVLHEGSPLIQPDEFVNAGHLNDRGAQRYSRWLGEQLAQLSRR